MSSITVRNPAQLSDYYLGAIICRTPRTLNDTTEDGITKDNRCVVVSSARELFSYFGNPFINPAEYTDLTIAYRLASNGIPVCVSSVYDMKDNDDNFEIHYNGYTHFVFMNKNGEEIVGYELKSDIKFCQPIIQSSYINNILTIYVSLYLLDRDTYKKEEDLNILNESNLYRVVKVSFSTLDENSTLTDNTIVTALKSYGLELHIINSESDTSLVDKLIQYSHFNISPTQIDSAGNPITDYHYELNSNMYCYGLSEDLEIHSSYRDAILRIKDRIVAPDYICLGKLYKSLTTYKDGNITRSVMADLNADNYNVVHNILLSLFDEECNTYLFINTPDVSASTVTDAITASKEYEHSFQILENYNCDLFFGYVSDFIAKSLSSTYPSRIYYSVASLVFFSVITSGNTYTNNSVANLNIANRSIKSIINESSAKILQSARCNSLVTFDTGYASIYGNRSLSLLPNLRYSHISRNFIKLRKELREYLDTKKFSINTFSISSSISNYIKYKILDSYLESGILSNYKLNIVNSNREITVGVSLLFNAAVQEIELNFII